MKNTLPLDKIVSKVAALGVPGLVLTTAIAATGLTGAAAITAALAALGPGGMIGGIAFLGVTGLIAAGLAEYGADAILSGVIRQLYLQGETKDSLKIKVSKYLVSKSLRLRLIAQIEAFRI